MRNNGFSTINRSTNKINLLIIGVGILAIIITGFLYASKLKNMDSPQYATVTAEGYVNF